ncbi:MAG: aminoglycoside phosphotransferase family protein [Chloroflexota bacterium]
MNVSSDEILAVTMATEPVVGSNRRGEMAGAGWLYALPRLDHHRIVCVGAPSAATLAGLRRAGEVTVAGRRDRPDPAIDGSIDLLVIQGRGGLAYARERALLERLGPEGIVYLETPGPGPAAGQAEPSGQRSGALPGPAIILDVSPFYGEARAVVPAADRAMSDAVRKMGLEGTILHKAQFARIERWVTARSPWRGLTRRRAALGGPGLVGAPTVPRYIHELAAASGRDLTGWRWAVAARGDYDSQKVLVLLAARGAPAPTGMVKVTRSAAHAGRLRNEADALRRLQDLAPSAGRVPVPWFAGDHAERAVLGASLMAGVPFAARATWSADDPALADALGWLTDLATVTARPVPAREVGATLLRLLERYARIQAPDSDELAALRHRFQSLADLPDAIPVVMQHGDPGTWNLLLDPTGRTVFLDWEAAETNGLPLWDLLYLFRSYAVTVGRRSGVRDRSEAAARHLLGASPLADRLVDAVATYVRRVGVPAAAIEPLVYGCWLHRSLKEATRLGPGQLASGQFVGLVRRMLADPAAPTLAKLFALPADVDGDRP